MNWIGINCPCCGEKFTDNDDVVVCPVCGTPHHKKCWENGGGCVNRAKHDSGYEFFCENDAKEKEDVFSKNKNRQTTENTDTRPSASTIDEGCLSGIPVSHIRMYVRQRNDSYVEKFAKMENKGSKVSFNIWAFLSPLLYSCYRKMSKCAITIMLLTMIITMLPSTLVPMIYEKARPDVYAEYSEQLDEYTKTISSATSQTQILNASVEILKNEINQVTTVVQAVMQLIMHIVFGLFSIYFYRQKVYSDIRFLARACTNVPEQYEYMLTRRGGGSVAMIFVGILANMMMSTFVSFI